MSTKNNTEIFIDSYHYRAGNHSFRQIAPFMGGLLGALTIYILVRKQMMYLSDKRKMKRSIAATLITAEAILCFLVPLGLVVWLAVVNLQNINLDPQAIIAPFG